LSQESYTRRAGEKIGTFELTRPLGRGGFSEVWEAERNGDPFDLVALKILIHPEHATQLRAEANALALVRGPGIVGVDAVDLTSDPPHLVLQLLWGGNLRRRLQEARGKLPATEAVDLALRMLEILGRVHRDGVVHGDLKPENVLFQDGDLHLADFGLSRRIAQRSATLSVSLSLEDARLAGTLDYMAPEQREGQKPTPRSDVFAMGVLLYELLMGERPQGVFAMPSKRHRGLPPIVDRTLACSLARDPRHRFPGAGAMLAFLQSGLRNDWKRLAAAEGRVARLLTGAAPSSVARSISSTLLGALLTAAVFGGLFAATSGDPTLVRGLAGAVSGLAVTLFLWFRYAQPWLYARQMGLGRLHLTILKDIRAAEREWRVRRT
jgi:serine/threonine protein kinase